MRFTIATIILTLSAGCSGSSVTAVDDPVQDSLDTVKESLSEAIASVQASTAPPPKSEDDESEDMPAPLPATLGTLVKSAQDLVAAATGKPIETDAKAILSTAQDLETKAKAAHSPAAIQQGLKELLSKVNELRRTR